MMRTPTDADRVSPSDIGLPARPLRDLWTIAKQHDGAPTTIPCIRAVGKAAPFLVFFFLAWNRAGAGLLHPAEVLQKESKFIRWKHWAYLPAIMF